MLAKLWSMGEGQVVETLEVFAANGVLTMAQLSDGHTWCLPQLQHLQLIQVCSCMGANACVCGRGDSLTV